MLVLIVYESIYGNTHAVAEAIGRGLGAGDEILVVPVAEASAERVSWADLIVVGGPTHAHGMTRENSRRSAREAVAKPESQLALDPAADGPGLREWFESLGAGDGKHAAAFDTRISGPALLTGRAASGIGSELRRRGYALVVEPESFLVDRHNELLEGEVARAESWGASLAEMLVPTA